MRIIKAVQPLASPEAPISRSATAEQIYGPKILASATATRIFNSTNGSAVPASLKFGPTRSHAAATEELFGPKISRAATAQQGFGPAMGHAVAAGDLSGLSLSAAAAAEQVFRPKSGSEVAELESFWSPFCAPVNSPKDHRVTWLLWLAALGFLIAADGKNLDTKDAWGRTLDYKVDGTELVTLTSLGADDRLGGDGEDRDMVGTFNVRDSEGRWQNKFTGWKNDPL